MRSEQMNLPEHLIPQAMLGQVGRNQRCRPEIRHGSVPPQEPQVAETDFVSPPLRPHNNLYYGENSSGSALLLSNEFPAQATSQPHTSQHPSHAPYPIYQNIPNSSNIGPCQPALRNGLSYDVYENPQTNNSSSQFIPTQNSLYSLLQATNGSSNHSNPNIGTYNNQVPPSQHYPQSYGPPSVPHPPHSAHGAQSSAGRRPPGGVYAGLPQMNHSAPGFFGSPHPNQNQQSPMRKAPRPVMKSTENRRIVSSPTVPHYPSNHYMSSPQAQNFPSTQDMRTSSLTASSTKHNSTPSNYNQPSHSQQAQNSRSGGSSTGSSHTFSLSSKSRSFSSLGKLSSLSTKKFSSSSSLQKTDRNVSSSTVASQKTLAMQNSRRPIVYPAILSRVAKALKDSIILTINMKDGLEYHDSFTGKVAVDAICNIIRTNDRNLALLLGRSLDAQKFFHDVTYNNRLRDSSYEVYSFSRVYSDVEFFADDGAGNGGSNNNSNRGSLVDNQQITLPRAPPNAPYPTSSTLPSVPASPIDGQAPSFPVPNKAKEAEELSGVNGVFTILTNCYSPTCTRDRLCYSIACPRRLEQQARLNMKPRGGLKRAVSRLSLHEDTQKTLWHDTVDQSVLDNLDKHEKMRQELIYELIYTERDYVKDLEFMTDFYILPLRNPANNIIPEREREAFIRTVFGGVSDLLRLAKSLSEALTARQQHQKPVVEIIGDVFLQFVQNFDPFIKYSGNKVFASFEHERQQQVNMKYARFLEAIEKKPESRKQDLSSFLIKGVQRPARYQLLLGGILKNTKETSPDHKNLVKAKEEIEKVLSRINIQTGESTDRHKIMVLHRLLGRQTLEERHNFKLNYNNRIIYQVTLSRKRDNEKIDLYLFEHALLLVKHKIQNKREVHKVFERPMYLPLMFVNSGYESPTIKSLLPFRENGSIISDTSLRNRAEVSNYNPVSSSQQKHQVNFLGLGNNPVHVSLYADDVTNQSQILLQVQLQQRRLAEKYDIFSLSKYETRRFTGHNRINCAVPCYGGKKLLYGTDSGVWVSTVRSISMTSNEKICSDPTLVISKPYVTQMEVLVEYSKLLVLSEKVLYEFDLSCTDSLDHIKNTRSGKVILNYVSSFKTGICDGRLLVCAIKSGSSRAISIVEPTNPFDPKNKGKGKKLEVREIAFLSEPISISFLKTKLCIGCSKGFEILSLEAGKKEPILDEADPSLDFATQRESVTPLGIHRLDKNFLLSYSEFSFLINHNGWRTKHDWGIFWEGCPQNIALFYPYLLAFDPGFIEIRDLESTRLIRALVGENIRFLHSNEHEALYACEENGYDIIVSIDFLNLKPKPKQTIRAPGK